MAQQKLNQTQFGTKYSLEESLTGDVWIDGKPIYGKTISTGILPNATIKDVPHGISNIDRMIKIYGHAKNGSNVTTITLPFAGSGQGDVAAYLNDSGGVRLNSYTSNRSDFTTSYITLEYTKS